MCTFTVELVGAEEALERQLEKYLVDTKIVGEIKKLTYRTPIKDIPTIALICIAYESCHVFQFSRW